MIDRDNLWDPVAAFAPMIRAAKAYGSLSIPQLSFPGRQAGEDSCLVQPLSASEVQLEPAMGKTYAKPRPMTKKEIDDLIERFKYGAEVLYKAGADGCQVSSMVLQGNMWLYLVNYRYMQAMVTSLLSFWHREQISGQTR